MAHPGPLVESPLISVQVKHLTQVCEGEKLSQLLSTTSSLWFWRRITLCGTFPWYVSVFYVLWNIMIWKWLLITMPKRACIIFQPIFSYFFRYIVWPEGPWALLSLQKPISLLPVIASAILSIVFLDNSPWRSTATALLVNLGLFSLLRRSKSVTTCSSTFCPFTGSPEVSPLNFTATVKSSLECCLTWLQLLPLSFLPLLLFYIFQNHLDKLYTCWDEDPLLSILSIVSSIRLPERKDNLRLPLTWVYYLHWTSQITIRPTDKL